MQEDERDADEENDLNDNDLDDDIYCDNLCTIFSREGESYLK